MKKNPTKPMHVLYSFSIEVLVLYLIILRDTYRLGATEDFIVDVCHLTAAM